MAEINYKLDVFEGPMELLLHLITKHKLNIYDIPIFELVEQYLSYINQLRELDLDIASEFLDMAARLIYIKTLSLLPVPDEGEKLRTQLSGELIEYAQCRQAAQFLSERTDGLDMYVRPQVKLEADMSYGRIHDVSELFDAYMRAVGKKLRSLPPPFEAFREIVVKKVVSVSSKIQLLADFLKNGKKKKFYDIVAKCESRSDMIAVFLAVLELAKTNHIDIYGSGENTELKLLKIPEGEFGFD